jgi:hypothetical protein
LLHSSCNHHYSLCQWLWWCYLHSLHNYLLWCHLHCHIAIVIMLSSLFIV